MDLASYETMVRSENTARKYLLGFCWKNHQRFCPRCRHRKVYALASGRRRCARCKYTFHDFTQRFLNLSHIGLQDWLRLVKLFELETPPATMAEQTGLAPNTAAKAATIIRMAIAHHLMTGPQEHSGCLRHALLASGRAPAARTQCGESWPPVFGLLEKDGAVSLDVIPNFSVEALIHLKRNLKLRSASMGAVVYTDRYPPYLSLLVCCPAEMWRQEQGRVVSHRDKGLAVDSSQRFWRFAKTRLTRYRGVAPERFPLYLKELEFRYNRRGEDIFEEIARLLCAFVPDFG